MRSKTLLSALSLSILVCACSDVPSPDDDSVTADLEAINKQLELKHQLGRLNEAEVVRIEHEGGESVAIATVRLPSIEADQTAKPREVRLILIHNEGGWEIYDKNLEDPGSSTSMIFRGE